MDGVFRFVVSSFVAIGILAACSEAREAQAAAVVPIASVSATSAAATSARIAASKVIKATSTDDITGKQKVLTCFESVSGSGQMCIRTHDGNKEAYINFRGRIDFQYAPYVGLMQVMEIRVEYGKGFTTGQYNVLPSQNHDAAFVTRDSVDDLADTIAMVNKVVLRIPMANGSRKTLTFISPKGNFYKE